MKKCIFILTLCIFLCSCTTYSNKQEEQERKQREQRELREQRTRERELLYSTFNDKELKAIENNQYFIGMSRSALIESLGEPESLYEIAGEGSINEQFTYLDGALYIVVEDGVITSFFDIFTEKERTAIKNKQFFIGMSRLALIKSIGEPDDINETVGSWGVHEQFVYPRYDLYVYLENGVVTSWQK